MSNFTPASYRKGSGAGGCAFRAGACGGIVARSGESGGPACDGGTARVPGALFAESGELSFRSCGDKGVEQFFFEDGEVALEVLEVGRSRWRYSEDGEAVGDFRRSLRSESSKARGLERDCGLREMGSDAIPFEAGAGCLGLWFRNPKGGFAQVLRSGHHFLSAPGKAIDAAYGAVLACVVSIEGSIDAAQNRFRGECRLHARFRSEPSRAWREAGRNHGGAGSAPRFQ